ncbi:hypothetical protein [Stigmatella aurantiaca]|uniref:hypothetical protein n=1 Tax=Stigmatella aurantiaca TaxID=41 RepID=UPI0002F5380F|nr:hypothetical protein [Stigmatella aurantiaca]
MKPTSTDTVAAPAAAPKPSLLERFKLLVVEYGPLAIIINFALLFLTVAGFFVAIQLGFQAEGSGATAGSLAAAYAASQVVKPFRFAAVFALTPLVGRIPGVARWLQRNRPPEPRA